MSEHSSLSPEQRLSHFRLIERLIHGDPERKVDVTLDHRQPYLTEITDRLGVDFCSDETTTTLHGVRYVDFFFESARGNKNEDYLELAGTHPDAESFVVSTLDIVMIRPHQAQ